MSVLQKESTPFPRKRQPSAEGGEDVNYLSAATVNEAIFTVVAVLLP